MGLEKDKHSNHIDNFLIHTLCAAKKNTPLIERPILLFFFLSEMRAHCVVQVGLKLLPSSEALQPQLPKVLRLVA